MHSIVSREYSSMVLYSSLFTGYTLNSLALFEMSSTWNEEQNDINSL